MVGLIIAKEQRVSDFRQAWIDGLRGEIALLIGTINAINEWLWSIEERKRKGGGGSPETGAAPPGSAEEYDVVHPDVLRMEEALAMIELRLNPKEDRAASVLKKARAVVSKLRFYKPVCRQELKDAQDELLKVSKSYLDSKWEIVKKGEPVYRRAVGITKGLVAVWIVVFLVALVGWTVRQLATDTAGDECSAGRRDAGTQ